MAKYYNIKCKIKQYIKYQKYKYLIYKYKNKLQYIYCLQNYNFDDYFYLQDLSKQKYNICNNIYIIFDFKYFKQQEKRQRIVKILKIKLLYYIVKTIKAKRIILFLKVLKSSIIFSQILEKETKYKIVVIEQLIQASYIQNIFIVIQKVQCNNQLKKNIRINY